VELRLAIADRAALDAALQEASAWLIGEGTVRTTAFDFPDRRLRAARQTVRLREDWTGTTLTAKVPLSAAAAEDAGLAKAREEINLPLAQGAGDAARRLLESIGLIETFSYDKERRSWQLGPARVDVDVLADGGDCYVEIEAGPTEIAAARSQLHLDGARVETRSYFEIVHLARTSRQ
jgi:adenylate cyclase class IV